MDYSEIEARQDCEIIYVHGAVVSNLAQFLDAAVPWVWILGHRPNRYVQWWNTAVAINTDGARLTGLVRNLCFDLQIPTQTFLAGAVDFDDHGIALIQSHRPMPDTLSLAAIPESQHNRVLRQNGATLSIYLPHAIETAQVQSFVKGYLATIVGG
jgi:hypothetical protein